MSESILIPEKNTVGLYLDQETRKTLENEARRYDLSFSAFLRVMGRIFREPSNEILSLSIDQLRQRIREIIDETERRV